jgi:hypothetical protein
MIQTPQVPTLAEPVLIDYVFEEVQQQLIAELAWLDVAFGKAQRVKEVVSGSTIVSPVVYAGGKKYVRVFPDQHIGNFTFFDVENGEDSIIHGGAKTVQFVTRFGLVVWFDFRKVYPDDWQQRTIDNVKNDVLQAIKNSRFTRSHGIRFFSFQERAERIYTGYTDKEINQQFLIRPFGGFRINGEIKYKDQTKC